jgi:hypothetical protein
MWTMNNLLHLADLIQTGLTQLGLSYEIKKAGLCVPVSFKDIQWVDQGDGDALDFALLEVDMARLPPRVSAPRLIRPDVLHHLTAVVGKPVYFLNTSGVTYCVDLRPPIIRRGNGSAALPERVDFTTVARPEGTPPDHLALGITARGPLWVHPEQFKNALIVGAQGYGKSGLMRLLVYQALRAGWKLLLADPEGVTFNPHLWRGVEALIGGQVAASPHEVALLFDLALKEIERRSALYNQAPGYPDSLEEYNTVAAERLPCWGLFVDEANTYFADKGLVEGAAELARRGRKWGLHCVFAGHDWRANEIPRGMSGMLQTRVAFRVNDDTSGRVVLGRPGAEDLPAVPGRAILKVDGYHLIQVFYLDKEQLVECVERQPRVEGEPFWDTLAGDELSENEGEALAERARAMYAQGVSKRQIALTLYGGDGGAAWRRLETALASSTTTA